MVCARTIFATVVISAVSVPAVLALPEGAPSGFDGSPASGFTSCSLCHTGPVGSGSVQILGAPDRYIPGNIYDLTVRVFDPAQFGAGFELSVETPSGLHVGNLSLNDPTNTQYASADPNYVTHTMTGHESSEANWAANGNKADFVMRWLAPAVTAGSIDFYVAGNATNSNFSASGDTVYLLSVPSQFNSCPPDIDGNGVVDAADLASMLAAWGTSNPNIDTNGDGVIDSADLAGLLAVWGVCP
jgi:hypothetical protein